MQDCLLSATERKEKAVKQNKEKHEGSKAKDGKKKWTSHCVCLLGLVVSVQWRMVVMIEKEESRVSVFVTGQFRMFCGWRMMSLSSSQQTSVSGCFGFE